TPATLAIRTGERRLAPASTRGALGGIGGGLPTARPRTRRSHRAAVAARRPLRTDGGAEVEHRLVPVPAAPRGHDRVRQVLSLASSKATAGERARQHPRAVDLDHADATFEGERQDRSGGVGPDAGESPQGAEVGGKLAAVA